jgi:hypothetical protein
MEHFFILEDYPNYAISRRGEVKNIKTGLILKPRINNNYLRVGLINNGIRKGIYIHQLMAIAYLNHKPNGYNIVVDHINNNPLDNRIENLQLITQRKNTSKDRNRNLPTRVYKTPSNKFCAKIIINGRQKHIGTFSTIEEASQAYQNAILDLNI